MAKEDDVFTGVLEAEKMFVRNREEMLEYEARERYEMEDQVKQATNLSDKKLANLL